MAKQNNYDNIAFGYDRLGRLVFGNHIKQSQVCLLPFISPGNTILIVGGGTGWILEEISRIYPSGLHIVYIEASAKMMKLAATKNTGGNTVDFLNTCIEQYQSAATFDIIITAFLFDNFTEATASAIFKQLHALLNEKGKWLFADFVLNRQSSYFHKLLLKTMYRFFKLVSNVQAEHLADISPLFLQNNYEEIFSRYFYDQFIKSVCWVKR